MRQFLGQLLHSFVDIHQSAGACRLPELRQNAVARRDRAVRLNDLGDRFRPKGPLEVVGPLLASSPPAGKLRAKLERLSRRDWDHPTGKGPVRFSVSTIERWYPY